MLVADRYRLDVAIGRGGMGEVWRGHDQVLGRPVAVKLMLAADSDPEAAARFRLEAQTAARLHHPQVVTVFDFGAWQDRFFLVMELVEGHSLAQELETLGPLPVDRVAAVAAQTAAGLAAAHRQGVIHRDIKPGNLIRGADDGVKIADFGIARFADDSSAALTGVGQIVGTSLYLAPERALGSAAGPGSDVYALGCVLYQLLVGEPPFQSDHAAAVLHQHVAAAPAPPSWRCPRLPGAFEEYLLRMLAKRPEERPAAQEVADWFATAVWQGAAAASVPAEAPASSAYAMPRTAAPAPTVYALPKTPAPAAGSRRAPAASGRRRSAKPGRQEGGDNLHLRVRALMRRHKVITIAVAGAVALVVSTLLSMAAIGPGN
ncbi:serine/threonine-protein kinase [Peterkaempfera sp. SMS 1(5)a]|uniref:serine/threonine-protein kinase n=1 Tax=Peterkaempfera podocarpi TaxID=3232308 RepID=UPI00366FBB25